MAAEEPTQPEDPEGISGAAGIVELRAPTAEDAADLWSLAGECESLDRNTPYAYLLLATHFAGTGLIARSDERLDGFVLGYARPDDASTVFVWQVAVAPHARGRHLGSRLLDGWFSRCARDANARFVEATVTPSNAASRALFESFAKRHAAPLASAEGFASSLFPSDAPHEAEVGLRIGPIPPAHVAPYAHTAHAHTERN